MKKSTSPKIVLVTGCSQGGIGFYLCEEFAERGCKVYATSRKVETMEGFRHSSIERLRLDVTSDEDVDQVIKNVLDQEGRIDVVVNNAGVIACGAIIDQPLDYVKQVYDTNTFSVLRVAKAVIPSMAKRKSGLIINIGSIAGNIPTPWNGLYCSTKAALHSISEILWMECKPFNIDVMLVAPGSVKSNIANNNAPLLKIPDDSLYKEYTDQILARMNVSQTEGTMPTAVFAKKVVGKALRARPPWYISLGGNALLVGLLAWLPRTWALAILWRKFSRKR